MGTLILLGIVAAILIAGGYWAFHKVAPTETQALIDAAKKKVEDEAHLKL